MVAGVQATAAVADCRVKAASDKGNLTDFPPPPGTTDHANISDNRCRVLRVDGDGGVLLLIQLI